MRPHLVVCDTPSIVALPIAYLNASKGTEFALAMR